MKRIGFSGNLPLAKREEQLKSLIQECEHPMKSKIVAYLRSGHELVAVARITRDALDPQKTVIGRPDISTDGEWVWSADVPFYVEKYNMELPEDFVRHMALHSWQVPDLSRDRLKELYEQL